MIAQRERLDHSLFQPVLFNTSSPFAEIEEQILKLDRNCFPNTYHKRFGVHKNWFSNPANTIVLLKHGNKIVGFSIARPKIEGRELPPDTCNVSLTAISPELQGNGLAKLLINPLREALKARGFVFWERNLAVENGWANSFIKHENDKLVVYDNEPRITEFGLKQYVKSRL